MGFSQLRSNLPTKFKKSSVVSLLLKFSILLQIFASAIAVDISGENTSKLSASYPYWEGYTQAQVQTDTKTDSSNCDFANNNCTDNKEIQNTFPAKFPIVEGSHGDGDAHTDISNSSGNMNSERDLKSTILNLVLGPSKTKKVESPSIEDTNLKKGSAEIEIETEIQGEKATSSGEENGHGDYDEDDVDDDDTDLDENWEENLNETLAGDTWNENEGETVSFEDDDIMESREEMLEVVKNNSETRQFPLYLFQGQYVPEPRLNPFIEGAVRNMAREIRQDIMDPVYFKVLPRGRVAARPKPTGNQNHKQNRKGAEVSDDDELETLIDAAQMTRKKRQVGNSTALAATAIRSLTNLKAKIKNVIMPAAVKSKAKSATTNKAKAAANRRRRNQNKNPNRNRNINKNKNKFKGKPGKGLAGNRRTKGKINNNRKNMNHKGKNKFKNGNNTNRNRNFHRRNKNGKKKKNGAKCVKNKKNKRKNKFNRKNPKNKNKNKRNPNNKNKNKRYPNQKNNNQNRNKNKRQNRKNKKNNKDMGEGHVEGLSKIKCDGDAEMQVFGNHTLIRSHMKVGPLKLSMKFKTKRGLKIGRRQTGVTIPELKMHTVTRLNREGSEMIDFLLERPHPQGIKVKGNLFPADRRIAKNIFSKLFLPNSFLVSRIREKAALALRSQPKSKF